MNLKGKEKEFLQILAKKGPKTYYDLYAKRRENIASSSTVWEAKKHLHKLNLIKEKKPKVEIVTGRERKYYDLTLMGLFLAFEYDPIENVDKIADRFRKELPLVFGKWHYFKEQGAKDIVRKHLVNVMKICAFEYQRFLEGVEQRDEKYRRYSSLLEKMEEKWMKERAWAARITDLFLYRGLETEHLVQLSRDKTLSKVGYGVLSFEEKAKLNSAIENDEELRLYKMMLQRRDAKEYLEKAKRYGYARPEFVRMPAKIEERLIERSVFRLLKKPDPYYEIIDAIFNQDFFVAALKLTEQYVGFPFENEEAVAGVPQFLRLLIERIFPQIGKEIMEARKNRGKLREDVKKYLDEVSLQLLSASYFYGFEPVKVWDQTFHRMYPHKKRLEKLENEPKKAKAVALKWARIMREILTAPKDPKQPKGMTIKINCHNCPLSETCKYAEPDFCSIRD